MKRTHSAPNPHPFDGLAIRVFGIPFRQTHLLLPGVLIAGVVAWLSAWLSDLIGVRLMGFSKTPISPVMTAIILGLILGNTVPLSQWSRTGLAFVVKKILRLGIVLLGIRLSIFDVLKLGALGVPIVLTCILTALAITWVLSKWLKLPERLGTLIAVGTSICGVSAIVATGPTIDAKEEEVAYAVAVITVFGIIATLAYPYLANLLFEGDAVKVGLFLGTSVHDTSQVTGSALVFSDVFALPRALDVATVTKLVRNVFMVAVIPLAALYFGRKKPGRVDVVETQPSFAGLVPGFVLGFLLLAVLRSIGDAGITAGASAFGLFDEAAWQECVSVVKDWAVNMLVVALAAVGLSTRFRTLRVLGVKPFVVGLGAALSVGAVSYAAISLLGGLFPQ